MDPLSVGSAVVGLVAGASRIGPVLYHFITHTRDAPKSALQIRDELDSITAALESLQTYIDGAATPNVSGRSMLSLRNIVATLTACVTTYSDLELVVRKCVGADGEVNRVKWMINESEIGELVQRLQAHKLSLTLMLMILQSESMLEARTSMTRLARMVESLVARDARVVDEHLLSREGITNETNEALVSVSSSESKTAFENDLNTSRVYRKLGTRPSLWSINTSQQGSMALSAFSNLTMDKVSNLSVIRLSVWSTDLSNASDYDFQRGGLDLQNVNKETNLSVYGSESPAPHVDTEDPYRQVRQGQRARNPAVIDDHFQGAASLLGRRSSRKIVPGLPRPLTFKRMANERLNKITEESASSDPIVRSRESPPSPTPDLPRTRKSLIPSSRSPPNGAETLQLPRVQYKPPTTKQLAAERDARVINYRSTQLDVSTALYHESYKDQRQRFERRRNHGPRPALQVDPKRS